MVTASQVPVQVTAPTMNVSAGSSFDAPVTVSDTTGLNITAYQFDIYFNHAVITPQNPAIADAGTLSAGWFFTVNANTPGVLKVSSFNVSPLQSL